MPAHKSLKQGNEAYESGNYDRALAFYNDASANAPDAAEVAFNKGAALYQKQDLQGAVEAFQDAAIQATEPELGGRAKFNLGNCAFRQAQAQREADIKQSIETCRTSIDNYQDALQLNPKMKNAAENIEIARLYLKSLLDEQQQQQQDQQDQEKNKDQQENSDENQEQQDQQEGEDQQQQEGEEGKEGEEKEQEEQKQGEEKEEGEEEEKKQQEQQQSEEQESEPEEMKELEVNPEARSILDEEKDNKQRRVRVRVGGRPVEKDW